jgi:hypothetical protein
VRSTLIAGDTLDFDTPGGDYPPTDGWTLKYQLTPRFTSPVQTPITLTASADGSNYRTQLGPATTVTWAAGEYTCDKWVEKVGARVTLIPEEEQVTIKPDPAAKTQGYDGRTQAAKAVDDLKAALATYTASQGHIATYAINGRSITFRSSADIVAQLNFWQRELVREKAAESGENPRRFYVRFQ